MRYIAEDFISASAHRLVMYFLSVCIALFGKELKLQERLSNRTEDLSQRYPTLRKPV